MKKTTVEKRRMNMFLHGERLNLKVGIVFYRFVSLFSTLMNAKTV